MISKDEAANSLKNKGYEAANDKGVVTVHLSQGASLDAERKKIKGFLKEINYNGSWGIKAQLTVSNEETENLKTEEMAQDLLLEPAEQKQTEAVEADVTNLEQEEPMPEASKQDETEPEQTELSSAQDASPKPKRRRKSSKDCEGQIDLASFLKM